MTDIEHWRTIVGWEYFQVSTLGRVRDIRTDEILPMKKYGGYNHVRLTMFRGQSSHFLAHRLVATAFISKEDPSFEVNHKNGIRDDNRVSNLEWISHADNIKHAFQTLKRRSGASIVYEKLGGLSPKCIKVDQIDASGCLTKRFNSIKDAYQSVKGHYPLDKFREGLKSGVIEINDRFFKVADGYKMTSY